MNTPLRENDIKILTDIEHVTLRPGMYLGSTKDEPQQTYLYEEDKILQREVTYVPGILKLFDEIISNSLDEAIRCNFQYATKIKVSFDPKENLIRIEDNGRGLPIEFNTELSKYTPEVIFTHLKAGSNFDDDTKGMLVGQFGVGGSLVPIFSKYFHIYTANGKQQYRQTYENNLSIINKPKIKESTINFTVVEYIPDFEYFKIEPNPEIYTLLYQKRVMDLAFAYPEITFYFNKQKINTSHLKSFLGKFAQHFESSEAKNGRLGVLYSDTEFQQLSFVNGADTKRGGIHIDYIVDQITNHLREYIKKKFKFEVKPIDIRSKLFIVLSIRMLNPQFDSQTKERLISNKVTGDMKTVLDNLLTQKFLNSILKNEEILEPIIEAYRLKLQVKDNIELRKLNASKKKLRINKYYQATKTKKYLVLTEGDSACNSLMSILGRDEYSFFPLRGKPLNSLEIKVSKMLENEEFKNIIQILNLRLDKDDQTDLNYEKILFATDADADGQHIKALLLCFFKRFVPSLLEAKRVFFLKTPIICGFNKKNQIEKFFFTLNEYKNSGSKDLKYSYYKGLGTWKKDDLIEIFKKKGMDYFLEAFDYNDPMIINKWMGWSEVEYRKSQIRNQSFNINAV